MSEEAIEYIKNIKNWWWNNSPDRIYAINKTDIEQFDIALNYIDKLQKENKDSKELYNKLLIGYNKLVQEHLELEKENKELKECVEDLGGKINEIIKHINKEEK